MPNQIQNPVEAQSSEHASLESRFATEKKESGIEFAQEKSTESATEKNVAEKDGSYQNILSKVQTQNDDTDDGGAVMQDASALHQQTDRESQITHLMDLASTKGVGYAVKVAKKAEDYYVLDQLHDRLLEEDFHDSLLSRGLIEDI